MRWGALEVLRCPSCGGGLENEDPTRRDIAEGDLRCASEGFEYPVRDGVPQLVVPARRAVVRDFSASYAQAWALDGWGSSDPEYYLQLPQRDVSHRHGAEWQVKARSMDALFALLDRARPARVLDLGCGMGWLSHHLALRGIDTYAMDVSQDARVGLGAATLLSNRGPPFERVWGEMERPPFADGAFDAVICNASLHYAADVEGVLRQAARMVPDRGLLIVMNSPVYGSPEDAQRALADFRAHLIQLGAGDAVAAAYHHFDASSLEDALSRTFGPTREERFDPGRGFRWLRRTKGLVLGMELARFPILAAQRRPHDERTESGDGTRGPSVLLRS